MYSKNSETRSKAVATLVSLFLFFLVFWTHGTSRVITSLDSRWSILTGLSLLSEGNLELNEYEEDLKKADYYCIYSLEGKHYNLFPVGPSLLAVPFIYVLDAFPNVSLNILPGFSRVREKYEKGGITEPLSYAFRLQLERAVASFIIAATTVLIYWIGKTRLQNFPSILISLIFAFGTSAWSQASRGLWQHGPSMLFLSASLLTFLRSEGKTLWLFLLGVLLSCSFIMRPTNGISLGVFSVLVFSYYRRGFLFYIHAVLISLLPFVHLNHKIYDAIFPPYYMPSRLGGSTHFFEAIIGNLLSPARGLFIFSPVLLFSLVGLWMGLKDLTNRGLNAALTIILILHLISISLFPHWWGGHSFGPRLFSDMIPYLIYFLIPVVSIIPSLTFGNRFLYSTIFAILAVLSVGINYKGATTSAVQQWNVTPTDIDKDPARIWDWRDLSFLRSKNN